MIPENFFAAGRLWLLLVVAGLVVVYVVLQARRRQYAVRFTNVALLDTVAPKRPGWRRHLPAGAFVLALGLLVIAWARPYRTVEGETVRVPRERATVIMAIDVSLSMDADDVDPTRLAAAQDAAKSFLDQVPETINVGLVTFDAIARVTVPPTTDRNRIADAIDDLELGEGTAIGEAIFAALDAIELAPESDNGDEPAPAAVVLMSDGETTQGRPDDVGAEAAREADVPVSTIAFGTPGGQIDIPGEGIVPVPVHPEALAAIAEETGGEAYEAASEDELAEVYENIGSSVGFEEEQLPPEKKETTARFVGYSMVALAAAAAMSLVWFARLP